MRGVALIVIGAGVIGLVDNVLRPVLLSGRTSVSGLMVFIGLLGGVSAFGFVGLVLGPIVLVIAAPLLQRVDAAGATRESVTGQAPACLNGRTGCGRGCLCSRSSPGSPSP